MEEVPRAQRSAVKRTCWTLGCGGAGFVGTLAMTHGPGAPAAIAVGVVAAFACNVIAGLSAALPDIIKALSVKKVACTKAKADATIALEAARQRTALINAGLEGKLEAALCLLKLQMLNAHVLAGRRLSEDMLRELLPDPRVPYEGDSGLAVVEPRTLGSRARHAKDDTHLTSSLAIDAQARQSRSRVTEHP